MISHELFCYFVTSSFSEKSGENRIIENVQLLMTKKHSFQNSSMKFISVQYIILLWHDIYS